MKKRLESELISIAHRILKLKNKSEVDQLYKETQKLYETLSVLKFYQDNFESVKSDVSSAVLEEKLEQHFEEETPNEVVFEIEPLEEPTVNVEPEARIEIEEQAEVVSEEAIEAVEEHIEEVIISEEPEETLQEEPVTDEKPSFQPIFELEVEEEEEEEIMATIVTSEVKPEEKLEDMIGNYVDPVFVKPNEVSLFSSESKAEETEEVKPSIANETMSKSIAIGLNDRIGFVQHLFNDSNED